MSARAGGQWWRISARLSRGGTPADATRPDAVEFFRTQGIRGTHTEIEAACEPYGYHPLCLRLLAGLIVGDFQQPGDIAAAKRLDVSGDLIAAQASRFEDGLQQPHTGAAGFAGAVSPASAARWKYEALESIGGNREGWRGVPTGAGRTRPQRQRRAGGQPAHSKPSTPGPTDLVARGLLHHDRKGRPVRPAPYRAPLCLSSPMAPPTAPPPTPAS